MVRLLHVVLVDDLAVHADAGVLVDDGPLDGGAGADANGGAAGEVLTLVGLLVVVSTHDHDVFDDAVLLDVGAETDHRVGELALLDEAAVADGALGDLGIKKLAGGEEARLGVDGGTSLVEAELGLLGVVAREVSVEECLDGTDILPVAIVEECLNVHAEVLGVGDDLTAEVVARGEVLHKQLLHGPGVEDVDSHGRDVRHLLGALGIEAEDGGVHHHRLEGVTRGLLGEVDDLAGVINLHEAERRGALLIHGHGGDGDVSLGLAMLQDEGLVVHAVEVITGKDDVLVALGLVEEPDVLAHSICGALEPVLVLGRLLRGEHLDETLAVVGADVVVVRLRKVSVERGGVELREAVHLVDVGVDAVGHGQVDEPVVGAKGNRGLGAGLGERIQAGARTTAEDDAEDILRCEEDGYWRQSRGRVLQWGKGAFLLRARSGEQKRAEQTRALTSVLSLTSVAVSVAISALVATARVTRFTCAVGDGMGEGLSQNDARVLRSAAHAFAGARGRRKPTHLGLRHDTAGRDGLTAHSLAGACGWEDTNVVASANRSMNLSRARSRRGATTLLRRSEAPAIGRARGKPNKKSETRDGERTELGGGDAGRESGRLDAHGNSLHFPWTGGEREVCFAQMGYGSSGRCPIPFFLKAKEKKLDNLQSSWHAQSYPSLSRGFRGGSRPLIWLELKNRSLGDRTFFLAMGKQSQQAQDFWNRGLWKYLKLAGFFCLRFRNGHVGFCLQQRGPQDWPLGKIRQAGRERKRRSQTFSST